MKLELLITVQLSACCHGCFVVIHHYHRYYRRRCPRNSVQGNEEFWKGGGGE